MASAAPPEIQISLIRPLAPSEETMAATRRVPDLSGLEGAWDQTRDELRRLRTLEEDWDGQGASAPELANLEAASA